MTRLCLNSEKMQPVVEKGPGRAGAEDKNVPPGEAFSPPQGKTVIVVDDGIATGFTVEAALKSIKNNKPTG